VSFKFHVCDVVRVAQTDLATVAAARGCGRVAGGCLRYGNWLAGVTMICAAGRWLSGIRTNLVRSGRCAGLWWLGVRGQNYPVQVAWSEMASSVESVCAGELHNDAVNVAVCRARTSRLREMHCSWLVGGGTQGDVSETERL
jgi:hypothetical protein